MVCSVVREPRHSSLLVPSLTKGTHGSGHGEIPDEGHGTLEPVIYNDNYHVDRTDDLAVRQSVVVSFRNSKTLFRGSSRFHNNLH